jgi:hypothetical protein
MTSSRFAKKPPLLFLPLPERFTKDEIKLLPKKV